MSGEDVLIAALMNVVNELPENCGVCEWRHVCTKDGKTCDYLLMYDAAHEAIDTFEEEL